MKYRVKAIKSDVGDWYVAQRRIFLFFWLDIGPIRPGPEEAVADITEARARDEKV